MKELKILEFQAKHIAETFRIVANILDSRNKEKETCADRMILKSIDMIKDVLAKTGDNISALNDNLCHCDNRKSRQGSICLDCNKKT